MNSLREICEAGRTAFGLWSVVPGSFGVEILSGTGFDGIYVGPSDLALSLQPSRYGKTGTPRPSNASGMPAPATA